MSISLISSPLVVMPINYVMMTQMEINLTSLCYPYNEGRKIESKVSLGMPHWPNTQMTRLSDNIGSILMEVEILTYTYIRNIENDNLNSSILCETLQVLRQQMDHIKHEANKVKA